MGTRGAYGFRLDGEDRLSYNHYDSYPSCLGEKILQDTERLMSKYTINQLKDKVRNLKSVHPESTTDEEIRQITEKYHNTSVSLGTLDDPYCCFREAQGDIIAMLDMGYFLEANSFILNSLFCEWAYIINLDTEELEIWKGFQKAPSKNNRYGKKSYEDYYPCTMIKSFSLHNLSSVTHEDMREK